MDYAFLGRSGLSVSRVGFGTATFAFPSATGADVGIGNVGVPQAQRMVGLCRDAGINYFDTADAYSNGESETILGKALGSDRHHVLIGSKASLPMGPGQHDSGASRQHIIRACEDSLRRLGTDWIDLYQLHWPDYLAPIEETLRALDDLVRAGKVRYIGCSNFSAWHMVRATTSSSALNLERFISHQISYSLPERDAERELIPAAVDQGVGIMVWGPLAGGFLSGKYERDKAPPKGTRFAAWPNYPSISDWTKAYEILDTLKRIASARGRSVAEAAVNWVLRKPWVSSVVLGARDEAQLKANLKAIEWTLTPEEVAELDTVSATRDPYPYSAQKTLNAKRTPPLPAYRA